MRDERRQKEHNEERPHSAVGRSSGLKRLRREVVGLPCDWRELVRTNVVIITEGEKKADEVSSLGLMDADGQPIAVTCTGGADSWCMEYVNYFQNKRVVVFPDTDESGQRYAQAVTASFNRA
jgi:hypothetical protein